MGVDWECVERMLVFTERKCLLVQGPCSGFDGTIKVLRIHDSILGEQESGDKMLVTNVFFLKKLFLRH